MPMPTLAAFTLLDWSILLAYFVLVIAVGFAVSRKNAGEGEFFLGNRNLPTWAVAVSLVATMLSTATFVGVPDTGFSGDLTYLILNIGGFIAVFLVAWIFVPRLYHAGTVTIYGFLAQRFGEPARLAVSAAFIVGRMLSSGARLFLAAIPLCMLMFDHSPASFGQIALAICLISLVGTFYATIGGVRAVVWVDTIQFAIVVGTAIVTVIILYNRIGLSPGQMVDALAATQPADSQHSKLAILSLSTDPAKAYTLWAAIFGNTFVMLAAYGVDHDLAQRFLISKSALKGSISIISAQFIGIVVVSLFLAIGMLLYLFYHPANGPAPSAPADGKSIYPWFLQHELPTGLAGLSIAGLFAVAQGSLDSAMNALASSIIADIIDPMKRRRQGTQIDNQKSKIKNSHAPKWTVALVGVTMCLFAIFCAAIYNPKTKTLLDFVLGIMTFAYAGMLGVFLTALLTKRGSSTSVIAALIVGALTVTLLQDAPLAWWSSRLLGHPVRLAWPWWMPIATGLAFFTCVMGKPKSSEHRV